MRTLPGLCYDATTFGSPAVTSLTGKQPLLGVRKSEPEAGSEMLASIHSSFRCITVATSPTPQELTRAGARWQFRPGRVITPMGLALSLSLVGDATLYTVLPTHTGDAGIALGTVGIILGVNRAARLFYNTPVGMAYDRWARRPIFLPAAGLGVLSTVVYALSNSFWPLFAGRLLWGLAWSGLWVGAQAITLDVAADRDRGRLMGWTQAWFFLGGTLSFLIGGYLTDLLSYRQALWIGAGLAAVGVLVAAFYLPETRLRAAPQRPQQARTGIRWSGIGPVLGGGGWIALYSYGVLRFCMAGVVAATLSLFVAQQLGDQLGNGFLAIGASTLTGILLGARPMLSLITAPWAGHLSDRRGHWALLRWGSIIGMAGFVTLAQGSLTAIIISGLLSALSMGMLGPVTSALVGDLAPTGSQGRSLGWLATAGDFGSALGPVVAYALLSRLGLSAIYFVCALLMASIWASSFAAKRPTT